MPTYSVIQILTGSIAPVIVISGVGLVLLSISNRFRSGAANAVSNLFPNQHNLAGTSVT